LPANRRLRRHIFHLLKATVRAFHTGLSRRRFGHLVQNVKVNLNRGPRRQAWLALRDEQLLAWSLL
jgi:hypothetical protein